MTAVIIGSWVAPVDLDNCASEPIHVPGAIQPHGVLIAVTEPDLTIAVVSSNIDQWFGCDASATIGRGLEEIIGKRSRDVIDRARLLEWQQRFDEIPLEHEGRTLIGTIYRSGPYLVIEIERAGVDAEGGGMVVREAAMALQASPSVVEVADAAARWIRSLSDFDRVMVYRFDGDWNGEVIAERKRDDLNTFLGLHYPASDIPAQARELYRRNWLRLIPDIAYVPVPLVPPVAFDTARPLDLSTSTLRSVSPIHVEYLSNMGVGASMSVSIVVNGELWGLIACHHYSGSHHVRVEARNAAEFLAQLISLRIAETLEADARSRTIELTRIADHVAQAFAAVTQLDVAHVLRQHESEVLDLAGAGGFLLRANGVECRLGDVPDEAVVDEIVACWPGGREVLTTDRLGEDCPELDRHEQLPSGVLAFPLTTDRADIIAWFRPELVRAIDWGGDPHNAKLAAAEGDHVRLSPRKSFDLWRETIRGRSEPWDESVVQAAERFSRHVVASLLRSERDAASLAKDLQRVMRPTALPLVDGYEFFVYAQTAGRGEIGGDWYDAFQLADGRIAVVVGDVAGHGLAAASDMAQLRNVLRAFLTIDAEPAAALDRLDDYMLANLPGSIATVVCATIDSSAGSFRVCHAGHPPALLVTAHDAAFLALDGDPLLGNRPRVRTDRSHELSVGDSVVMYSDGLVETRRLSLDDGMAALRRQALAQDHRTIDRATDLATRLLTGDHDDDVTLLIVRRTA